MVRGRPFAKGEKAAKGKGPRQKKLDAEAKKPAKDGTRRGRPTNAEVVSLLAWLDQAADKLGGVSPREKARQNIVELLRAGDKDATRMVWAYAEGPPPKDKDKSDVTIRFAYDNEVHGAADGPTAA
jgi:hypothetical protein